LVPVNSNIMGDPSAQPNGLKLVKDKEGAILSWNKVKESDGKQVFKNNFSIRNYLLSLNTMILHCTMTLKKSHTHEIERT